jgi:hypothetical protein
MGTGMGIGGTEKRQQVYILAKAEEKYGLVWTVNHQVLEECKILLSQFKAGSYYMV